MAKRQPISKSLRFEVLARDKFTCQYCGAKASDGALLHIDHIIPVKEGGTNEITNLVAACSDCNLGKGAKLLDSNAAASRKQRQLEELQERREQLEMLYEWELSLIDNENAEIDKACDLIAVLKGMEVMPSGRERLRKAIKQFGLYEVMEAIRTAAVQYEDFQKGFNKITGICWNRQNKSCNSCTNAEPTNRKWEVRCTKDWDEEDEEYRIVQVTEARHCHLFESKWS